MSNTETLVHPSPQFAKLAATRPQFAAWLEFCADRGLAPEEVVALLEKRAIELHISGFHPADIHVPKPVSVHATDVRSVPVESLHVAGTPHAVTGRVPAGELPVGP